MSSYTKEDFLDHDVSLDFAPDELLEDGDFKEKMIHKDINNIEYALDSLLLKRVDLVAFAVNRWRALLHINLAQEFFNDEYYVKELMSRLDSRDTQKYYYKWVSEEIKTKYDPIRHLLKDYVEETENQSNIKG
jgi:hypothetical protein